MRYRLQRHDGTDCSATMVPITVLRMVPIQRYRQMFDNPRIIRQSGAFFLYGINGNKSQPASLNFSYKVYIINKAQKQKIRKQLEALGIDKSTLFPEVEHVAEHIKDKYHLPK